MLCRECQQKMKETNIGGFDVFALMSPKIMYCNNVKCNMFGILTVAGIEEIKE